MKPGAQSFEFLVVSVALTATRVEFKSLGFGLLAPELEVLTRFLELPRTLPKL